MNLPFFRSIVVSSFLIVPVTGFCQTETNRGYPRHVLPGTESTKPVQWEETLAGINNRIQILLQENDLLMKEYESAKMELNDIQYKVNEQKRRNIEELERSRSLQMPEIQEQVRELRAIIKGKQRELTDRQKEAMALNKKLSVLENKIAAQNLKLQAQQERERIQKEQESLRVQEQQQQHKGRLAQKEANLTEEIQKVKSQIDEHKHREEAITKEIEEVRKSVPVESPEEIAQWQKENAQLQNQIDITDKERREKLEKQKEIPQVVSTQTDSLIQQKKEYLLGLKEKTVLESQIVNMETQLKLVQGGGEASLATLSFEDSKKETVTGIMSMEKSNDMLREQIINLKENVYILKDKIARLEDRVRTKGTINERKKSLQKYQYNNKRKR